MAFDNILHMYKNVYYKMPQSLKTFLGGLYGRISLEVRFGNPYKIHFEIVNKYENSTDQFREDFLYNKTMETLLFSQEHIPYYKDLFNKFGVYARDFKAISDINLFPLLTKDEIKNNLDALFTDCIERPSAYYTGGSTSVPTKLYLPLYTSRGKEKAYSNYIFSQLGYKYRDKAVLLKGRDVSSLKTNIYWEYEPVDNYLVLSSNYLNSPAFKHIHFEVEKYAPKYFFGYPSAILDYIRSSIKNGHAACRLQGVILSSEMVYEKEIQQIQDFFKCKVLVHYGHTERVVIAYQRSGCDYRPLNSYGLFRSVANEIVGTGFDNFVMPLINYRTNDYILENVTSFASSDVIQSVSGIEGRLQEHLVTKDGRLISICVMGAGHFSALENVHCIQYKQLKLGEVILLVESDSEIDCNKIKSELEEFTNNSLLFNVQRVNNIEKSSRGKRIMCLQHLSIDDYR